MSYGRPIHKSFKDSSLKCALHHGDCFEVMPVLPAQSVDMILADLPYGTTACAWDSVLPLAELWREYKRLIKPNGAILLFGVMPFSAALWQSNPKEWRYEFVWRKNGATRFLDASKRPLLDFENIEVFYSRQPTYNPQKFKGGKVHSHGRSVGKKTTSEVYRGAYMTMPAEPGGDKFPRLVLDFDKVPPSKILRATQKPVDLCEYLIRTYTHPDETILDNTMGAGSAGVACGQSGRRFIGIEKDRECFEIAKKRISQIHPPLFTEIGMEYAEVSHVV